MTVLAAHGVGLVELLFRRERPGWVLRVMIENPTGLEPGAGVTLDRCANVSRDLSAKLDEGDLIRPAYTLEVSSPGIERPLHNLVDYQRFAGLQAKLLLTRPIEGGVLKGQASVEGVLRGVEGEQVAIETRQKSGPHVEKVILSEIKHGHLVYDPTAGETRGRGTGKGAKANHPRTRPGKSSE